MVGNSESLNTVGKFSPGPCCTTEGKNMVPPHKIYRYLQTIDCNKVLICDTFGEKVHDVF